MSCTPAGSKPVTSTSNATRKVLAGSAHGAHSDGVANDATNAKTTAHKACMADRKEPSSTYPMVAELARTTRGRAPASRGVVLQDRRIEARRMKPDGKQDDGPELRDRVMADGRAFVRPPRLIRARRRRSFPLRRCIAG